MANKKKSRGTQLQVYMSGSYTKVPRVYKIEGPETGNSDEIDFTDLDMTVEEKDSGVERHGSVTFEINWDPADSVHQYLDTLRSTVQGTDRPAASLWRVVRPDGSYSAFPGWPKLKETGYEVNGKLQLQGEITITGLVTRA